MASMEVLSWHLSGRTEEYHEKSGTEEYHEESQRRSMGQDLNLGPPKYESQMLPYSTITFILSLYSKNYFMM
jgi:hypothetical protein